MYERSQWSDARFSGESIGYHQNRVGKWATTCGDIMMSLLKRLGISFQTGFGYMISSGPSREPPAVVVVGVFAVVGVAVGSLTCAVSQRFQWSFSWKCREMLPFRIRSNRWKIETLCECSRWPLHMFPKEDVRYLPQLKLPVNWRRVENYVLLCTLSVVVCEVCCRETLPFFDSIKSVEDRKYV